MNATLIQALEALGYVPHRLGGNSTGFIRTFREALGGGQYNDYRVTVCESPDEEALIVTLDGQMGEEACRTFATDAAARDWLAGLQDHVAAWGAVSQYDWTGCS